MISQSEQTLITARCSTLPERESLPIATDYVEMCLGMVLDFQMKQPIVDSAFKHFRSHHQLQTHRQLQEVVTAHSDSDDGNCSLAQSLWGYKLWTRAAYLRVLLMAFEERKIDSIQSLSAWAASVDFQSDVRGQFRTQRHSMGFTMFQYLRLRLGHETVKPDLRVIRFVQSIVGRKPTPIECVQAIEAAAISLGQSARALDAAIYSGNGA